MNNLEIFTIIVNVSTVILKMEVNAKKWMDNLAAGINAKLAI
jgi:hypothetical protein